MPARRWGALPFQFGDAPRSQPLLQTAAERQIVWRSPDFRHHFYRPLVVRIGVDFRNAGVFVAAENAGGFQVELPPGISGEAMPQLVRMPTMLVRHSAASCGGRPFAPPVRFSARGAAPPAFQMPRSQP